MNTGQEEGKTHQSDGSDVGSGREFSKTVPARRSFMDRAAYWATFDEERKKYFHFFEVIEDIAKISAAIQDV
jgi:hypothetical protein